MNNTIINQQYGYASILISFKKLEF